MTDPEKPPRGLSYLVVVVSADRRIQQGLPPNLAAVDPSVEIQVVPSLAILHRHLRALVPDAVVLDGATVEGGELPKLLSQRLAGDGPVVVLAATTAVANHVRENLLHQGACECIPRGPGDLEAVRDAIVRAGRIARLRDTLVEQERHFRDILEGLHDGVFVLDQGVFTYVNRSFAALLGHLPTALVGRQRLADCVVAEEQVAVAEAVARLQLGDGSAEPLVLNLAVAKGEACVYETQCHVSWVQGVRALVGVGRDMTAAKRTVAELDQTRQRAAQVERLRALGEMSAGVAHDFNNALGTILGRVCLARDKLGRNENVADDLRVIEMASRHAASTVQRIQEYSRPSNNDSWRDVNVGEVCEQAAAFIRTRVPPGVTLGVETLPVPLIRGNHSELREVLLNLLRNALDALGERGSIKLRCHTDGEAAVVEVEDDGPGMSEEVKRRLFEPFFSTKASAGTGLGLSVSHWILRRHDADIHVESSADKGTLFRLSFAPFHSSAPPLVAVRRKIETIMVVDDDQSVADMLRDLLDEQGFTVHVVSTATAALQMLARHPMDLVITDLDLPDLGGWQLARRLREETPDIIVGLMTGWPLGAAGDELHARGISFVLNKPFSMEALFRNLARLGH